MYNSKYYNTFIVVHFQQTENGMIPFALLAEIDAKRSVRTSVIYSTKAPMRMHES
ncbi:hypothetical protein EMIT07CA2_20432 [Brevibacillus sp. IT-7CA2]